MGPILVNEKAVNLVLVGGGVEDYKAMGSGRVVTGVV